MVGLDVESGVVIIEYLSGKFDVGVMVEDGKIVLVELYRIVWVLMKGMVYY